MAVGLHVLGYMPGQLCEPGAPGACEPGVGAVLVPEPELEVLGGVDGVDVVVGDDALDGVEVLDVAAFAIAAPPPASAPVRARVVSTGFSRIGSPPFFVEHRRSAARV
jgi:hypothetical protein